MFVQKVALDTVPAYAVVERESLTEVLRELTAQGELRRPLGRAFFRLEREQPALAEFVADELADLDDPEAQGLAYFLLLLVYLAFAQAFPRRLQTIGREDLGQTLERLIADGEAREAACPARSYSEDAIAQGQPAVVRFVREELDRSADTAADSSGIFEAVLLEILVLTHAVAPS